MCGEGFCSVAVNILKAGIGFVFDQQLNVCRLPFGGGGRLRLCAPRKRAWIFVAAGSSDMAGFFPFGKLVDRHILKNPVTGRDSRPSRSMSPKGVPSNRTPPRPPDLGAKDKKPQPIPQRARERISDSVIASKVMNTEQGRREKAASYGSW